MAMAQTAFRTRPAFYRHSTAASKRSRRAEMPLFQAFLRPSSVKVTDGLCIKDATTIDGTCGSGSFLVQAMVKEIADCRRDKTEKEAEKLIKQVKEKHIFGIEVEEKAYGLSTTNMLIHGDGNSNIRFGSIFDNKKFIMEADPDIILMNPPYNATPINIPATYKTSWIAKAKDGKEDPTKGFVFVHFLSDVIKELNDQKEKAGKPTKQIKLAVLLPVATAIGTRYIIKKEKIAMLENNTLAAVFTLPNEIFILASLLAPAVCYLHLANRTQR